MVRPCVASGFAELAVSGLASMYPASAGQKGMLLPIEGKKPAAKRAA